MLLEMFIQDLLPKVRQGICLWALGSCQNKVWLRGIFNREAAARVSQRVHRASSGSCDSHTDIKHILDP